MPKTKNLKKKQKLKINTPLREHVYQYLSDSIANGTLQYGEYFNQNAICEELGISKAPLRDALIRLEAEHFVEIHPNRGVLVPPITYEYIASAYQISGSLEASCLDEVFHLITDEHIKEFEASNLRQRYYLNADNYLDYYEENIYFHDIFLSLSSNVLFKEILMNIRRRLYDFPQKKYSLEWEKVNIEDHSRFIASLKKGNKCAAISVFRDEHWSMQLHGPHIIKHYGFNS